METQCAVCGKQAKFICGRCRDRYYCCLDCQKKDFPTHNRVCRESNNMVIDRFEMFMEENNIAPGTFPLTADGMAQLARRYQRTDPENYEFLKDLEFKLRKMPFEREFKAIIDRNGLRGFSTTVLGVKKLLMNFEDDLIHPETGRKLTEADLMDLIKRWERPLLLK